MDLGAQFRNKWVSSVPLRNFEISGPQHEICALTSFFRQHAGRALSELDQALKLFYFLVHRILYVIQEKGLELSSGWISWTAFGACVWLSGGWIVFLRDKEQGKNVESDCQKLLVGTWVGGGIATASSLSQRVVPVYSLGVYRAEHVSGKGCNPSSSPWHSRAWRGLKWWLLPLYQGRGGKTCKTWYLDFFCLFLSRPHCMLTLQSTRVL